MSDRPRMYHLGLTVSNIEESYRFYHEVIGLEPQNKGENSNVVVPQGFDLLDSDVEESSAQFFEAETEEFDKLTNNPGSRLKFMFLDAPDGDFVLQLIEYTRAGGEPLELEHNRAGSPHLSFYVADADEMHKKLLARGDVKVHTEVIQIALNMRSFYAEDPDGVPIEFLAVAP